MSDPSNVPEKGPAGVPNEPFNHKWNATEMKLISYEKLRNKAWWEEKHQQRQGDAEAILEIKAGKNPPLNQRQQADEYWGVCGYTVSHDEHSGRSSHGSRDPRGPSPIGDEGQAQSSAPGPWPPGGHQGPATAGWGPVQVVTACAIYMALGFGLGFILARAVL